MPVARPSRTSRLARRAPSRLPPLVAAVLALGAGTAAAAPAAPARAASSADAGPVALQAREIRGRPDIDLVAEGEVDLRRGPLHLQADWLSYQQAEDLASARGGVRLQHPSGRYSGSELQLRVQRFEGFVLQPGYEFERLQAGGRAERIDFIDDQRSVAHAAWYTSCPRDEGDRPAWVLQADRVRIDLENNEGVAEGAVLRFMDLPILALPAMSFPLGEGRKSGWLPPTVDLDSRSGLSVAVPYYWNIAPNRDATFTPKVITRRGVGLEAEYRYLEPGYRGQVLTELLPDDRVAGRSRWALEGEHHGALPFAPAGRWLAAGVRVSDDDWWKDFPRDSRSLNPRLLPLRLEAEHDLPGLFGGTGQGLAYARLLRWQVLQGSDFPIVSPYERAPQFGLQFAGQMALPTGLEQHLPGQRAGWRGLEYSLQTELNRFVRPDLPGTTAEPTGWRAHLLGSLALPWRSAGAWVVPRVSVNAASYALDEAMADGRTRASRLVPTFSIDAGAEFERDFTWWGQGLRQTLEPRVRYVNTPFRDQTGLPNFDSAGKDFNYNSIFSDNTFSGIDRVSDAHQVTAGVTTRLIDGRSGAETLRLGVVQRHLLRTQRITPEGVPYTSRLSDLYLLGGASFGAQFALDGALQYSPDIKRTMRTIVSGRWHPGEFRTLSATYRLTRGFTEQFEVGWQWPVWKSSATVAELARGRSGSRCSGAWYAVGRVNYSMKDSRVTDSILGMEYDAGCWIMRVVAERLSTGRSEATTRLQLQLELVGLSRLGSNPLKVLKDNIPGYRLLREERGESIAAPPVYD